MSIATGGYPTNYLGFPPNYLGRVLPLVGARAVRPALARKGEHGKSPITLTFFPITLAAGG